jgi:hypothetical protein
MRWLERLGFFVAGGVISAVILLALGKIELAGDSRRMSRVRRSAG